MQDFIGQTIEAGGWVAATGGGNVKTEYGSILYRVLDVAPGKLKLQRLRANFPDYKNCVADAVTTSASNPRKYIVVHPQPAVVALFNAVVQGTATRAEHERVGLWIHGTQDLTPWGA